MKKLILGLYCLATTAMAQSDKEVFHFKYGILPLGNQNKVDADILHAFDFNVKFPLTLQNKTLIAGGLGYETLWSDADSLLGGQQLQGVSTQLLINRGLENGRAILFFASAGIYSDFNDVSGEDYRYTIGFRYKREVYQNFNIAYGMAFSKQLFGWLIAPYIDFDWKIAERWRLSGPVPLNTRIRYTLTPKAELSLFLKPDNVTYRLSKKEFDSRYFQKKQWSTGLGLEFQMTQHWLFTLRGGFSMRQRFEMYEASETGVFSILTVDLKGGKRTPLYQYSQRNFFTEVVLAWVINKELKTK